MLNKWTKNWSITQPQSARNRERTCDNFLPCSFSGNVAWRIGIEHVSIVIKITIRGFLLYSYLDWNHPRVWWAVHLARGHVVRLSSNNPTSQNLITLIDVSMWYTTFYSHKPDGNLCKDFSYFAWQFAICLYCKLFDFFLRFRMIWQHCN